MTTFTDAFTRLRHEFDEARKNRQEVIGEIRAGVREAADCLTTRMASEAADRQAAFAAWAGDLRSQLKTQAEHTRGSLADLAADLRRGSAVFQGRRTRRSAR